MRRLVVTLIAFLSVVVSEARTGGVFNAVTGPISATGQTSVAEASEVIRRLIKEGRYAGSRDGGAIVAGAGAGFERAGITREGGGPGFAGGSLVARRKDQATRKAVGSPSKPWQ